MKWFVVGLILIGVLVGSVSGLVFFNGVEQVVPCGNSIFECVTSEKVSQGNDTSLLTASVLNRLASGGQDFNVLYKKDGGLK